MELSLLNSLTSDFDDRGKLEKKKYSQPTDLNDKESFLILKIE